MPQPSLEEFLLAELREIAPTFDRAAFLYADCPELGGYRQVRYLVVMDPGQQPAERRCAACGYRVLVRPVPGFNVVPQLCAMCRGPMKWRLLPRQRPPETSVTVAPRGGIPAVELIHWTDTFEKWARLHATRAIPDPALLMRLWALGHRENRPPPLRFVAAAFKEHFGMEMRPHPHSVLRLLAALRDKFKEGRA